MMAVFITAWVVWFIMLMGVWFVFPELGAHDDPYDTEGEL